MNLFSHLIFRFYIFIHERSFIAHKNSFKYMLQKVRCGRERVLIVVFSAYNKQRAGYNYIKTLRSIKSDKLFIKDNFGPNGLGSYYLGPGKENTIERGTLELIEYVKQKRKSSKIIFVGSSKGGYAALNFFLSFKTINSVAIVGAPQYLLASHLLHEGFEQMLQYILGKIDDCSINELDKYVQAKIANYNLSGRLYLQYSRHEEFYQSQINPLINDLKSSLVSCYFEERPYSLHSEVHKYFPSFLIQVIKKEI